MRSTIHNSLIAIRRKVQYVQEGITAPHQAQAGGALNIQCAVLLIPVCGWNAGAEGSAPQGAVGGLPGGGPDVHGPGARAAGEGAQHHPARTHDLHGRLRCPPRPGARISRRCKLQRKLRTGVLNSRALHPHATDVVCIAAPQHPVPVIYSMVLPVWLFAPVEVN